LSVNTLVEEDGSERFYGKRLMKKWFYERKEKIPIDVFNPQSIKMYSLDIPGFLRRTSHL